MALCPTSQLLVVNIVQGLQQRRQARWLRSDHYNYVDFMVIALLAFCRSGLPLAHPRHERIPPGLLSARPINLGPAVCMKRGRHGGRSQRGRVSFWTRVRGERTTTASLRNLISLPRCAKRRPVLQKTVRHHQLVIRSSYIKRADGCSVTSLTSGSHRRGVLLSMRHVGMLNLRVSGAQNGQKRRGNPTFAGRRRDWKRQLHSPEASVNI
jgi:hypothetical protein